MLSRHLDVPSQWTELLPFLDNGMEEADPEHQLSPHDTENWEGMAKSKLDVQKHIHTCTVSHYNVHLLAVILKSMYSRYVLYVCKLFIRMHVRKHSKAYVYYMDGSVWHSTVHHIGCHTHRGLQRKMAACHTLLS